MRCNAYQSISEDSACYKCNIIVIIREVFLIYLVLLLFNRLLPAKTVTVSTQTSRLGKFSYFGPLDILDVIPPSLDLITFENIVISRGT